jgi:hypothetical protein
LGALGRLGKIGGAVKGAVKSSPFITSAATEATQSASRGGGVEDVGWAAAVPLAMGGVFRGASAARGLGDKVGAQTVQQGNPRVYNKAVQEVKNTIEKAQKIKDPVALNQETNRVLNNTVNKANLKITDKAPVQLDKLKTYTNQLDSQTDELLKSHDNVKLPKVNEVFGKLDKEGKVVKPGIIDRMIEETSPKGVPLPSSIQKTHNRLRELQKELNFYTGESGTLQSYRQNRQIIQKQLSEANMAKEPESIAFLKEMYDFNNKMMEDALSTQVSKEVATKFNSLSSNLSDALYTKNAIEYAYNINPDWMATLAGPARNLTYLTSAVMGLPPAIAGSMVVADMALTSKPSQQFFYSAIPSILNKASKTSSQAIKRVMGEAEFNKIQSFMKADDNGAALAQYMIPKMFNPARVQESEKYRNQMLELANSLYDSKSDE